MAISPDCITNVPGFQVYRMNPAENALRRRAKPVFSIPHFLILDNYCCETLLLDIYLEEEVNSYARSH